MAASQEAVDDAALKITADNAGRVGVYIGAGIGGLPAIEQYYDVLKDKGPGRVSPFFILFLNSFVLLLKSLSLKF